MFFSWIPLSNLDQIEVGPYGNLQISNKKIIQIKKRQDMQKILICNFRPISRTLLQRKKIKIVCRFTNKSIQSKRITFYDTTYTKLLINKLGKVRESMLMS